MKQKAKSSRIDELRREYRRSDFPKGFIRGKYAVRSRTDTSQEIYATGINPGQMNEAGRRNSMGKNTSILLEDHFESFISKQIESGHYGSVSDVVRAGLHPLEEREQKVGALRQALIEGEDSGDVGELDIHEIRRKARRRKPGD
jgi:antitoxin ParD1/3/4